jgi:hypothetical protein
VGSPETAVSGLDVVVLPKTVTGAGVCQVCEFGTTADMNLENCKSYKVTKKTIHKDVPLCYFNINLQLLLSKILMELFS